VSKNPFLRRGRKVNAGACPAHMLAVAQDARLATAHAE
jgi:hypothetical protein